MPRNEGRGVNRVGQSRRIQEAHVSAPCTAISGLWAHCCSSAFSRKARVLSNPVTFKAVMWARIKLVSRSPVLEPFLSLDCVLVLPFL